MTRFRPRGWYEWRQAGLRLVVAILMVVASPVIFVWWVFGGRRKTRARTGNPLTELELEVRNNVCAHVARLAGEIGVRNVEHPEALLEAAEYIASNMVDSGGNLTEQTYEVDGLLVRNLESIRVGTDLPDEVLVVGAHYDTVSTTPGADDNASGVAALLEIARLLGGEQFRRTVRLVAFVNEEPPYFRSEDMGSLRYARACAARRDRIVGMLSLEMLGDYTDEPGSQSYPPPLGLFYPATGDFVGFVGNLESGELVRRAARCFRESTDFPAEELVAPAWVVGVDLSDQWSFWQERYPALMVTDTAFFRNRNYHKPTDTPETLDYDRLARVTVGLAQALRRLANDPADI